MNNELKPRFVRNVSNAIANEIIEQRDDMRKRLKKNVSKTDWLTAQVIDFGSELHDIGLDRMRMLVARVLKGYKPGKLRPFGTEFQSTSVQLWSRFSNQAKDMRINQAELLAYYVMTGEK